MEFRDLKQQYRVLKDEIDQAMITVAGNGTYIMGEQVRQLEQSLADYVNVRHCVTCANGTDALSLVLMYWGIGPGDAVFVPDFTFFATAEIICREGATPVLVDVDPATFNLDPIKLEKAIQRIQTQGRLIPRAIIPVDLFGLPADYARITPVAQKYGLKILEDGAQGFGGSISSQKACSFGDAATTSFFPAKPLGCYGDGGAIFTNDLKMAERLRSLQAHGKGTEKYDNVRIGVNSRLDTIQAAILQVKFKAFTAYELDRINEIADEYSKRLQDVVRIPRVPAGFISSWAQYTLRLENKESRGRLIKDLAKNKIPSAIYYPKPLHLQMALIQPADYEEADLQNSLELSGTVLSIPMHPYLSEQDIDFVVNTIRSSIRQKE